MLIKVLSILAKKIITSQKDINFKTEKMKLKIYSIICLFLILNMNKTFAWGFDVEVTTAIPQGTSSVVANSAEILYASVPQTSLNPSSALSIYQSTNNGETWTQLNVGGGNPGEIVVKSKMLVTGTDVVVCVYQIADKIFTLDIASGVVSPFTTIDASDFDAAASPNSNSIYLYVDQALNNNIRRYSSNDAGATWGSPALATTSGANPKIYMTGTRLYLSFYGTPQSDVQLSKIVIAIYNETGIATLTSGTFQDIVTNITVRKHQFQPVTVNGTVWFFWTEGTSPSVLKCRTSSTNGTTYNPEFVVSGSSTMEVQVFDAKHYANSISSGAQVAYYADSIQAGAPDPFTESIAFTTADISNAEIFSSPQQVSDFTVDASSSAAFNISLVGYFYSFSPASGVLWVEDSGSGNRLHYDASSSIVNGMNDAVAENYSLSIFPNPVQQMLNINLSAHKSGNFQLELRDIKGQLLLQTNTSDLSAGNHEMNIDLSSLSSGIYFLGVNDGENSIRQKIVKM